MKPRVKKNIQTECRTYIEMVASGKVEPLMIDGGDLKFPYFNGFVQKDRNSYKNMLGSMIGDRRFSQTVSATIDAEDLENPYHILPIGDDIAFFMNDDIMSIRKTIMEDPVGLHLKSPQIFDGRVSFPKNLVNLLAVLADWYRLSTAEIEPEDLTKLDRQASVEDRAQIAKRIRLLKGKISLAKRNLRNGSEGAQSRIDTLRAEIDRLRRIYTQDTQKAQKKPQRRPSAEISRKHQILKMAQEMRGRGFSQIFRFIVSTPIEELLDEALQTAFQKRIPHQISSVTQTIKMMDSDMISFLDPITEGYTVQNDIETTDDMEILLHTERYYLISSKLKHDLKQIFQQEETSDGTEEEEE